MTEKKYIELQKALNVCEMHYEHCLEMHDWSGDTTADNIKRDIKTLPTADVVPVVRCKDCKHYKKINYDDVNPSTCEITTRKQQPDDYCSYGERKCNNEL